MAVDDFQKRMSAKYVIDATAYGVVVTDGTAGVDTAERQSAGRTYEGIAAGELVTSPSKKGLMLGVY